MNHEFLSRLKFTLFVILWIAGMPMPGHAQENIRKPAVSGQFYPASPAALKEQIGKFLANAKVTPDPDIQALIVPHAGYVYSGQVAAYAYKSVQGQKYDAVIVIGFPHRVALGGIFVDDSDFYETPLGRVPINKEIAQAIRSENPVLQDHPKGDMAEHSVEVQVPFLQETIPGLSIVPIYMGMQSAENAKILSEALAKVIGNKRVLIVISTDLSHYHPYGEANAKDKLLISLFEAADIQPIARAFDQNQIEACGIGPLISLLLLRQEMGWAKPSLIQYANSGDVTGDHSTVVGYTAMAIKKTGEQKVGGLTDEDKKKMLQFVRNYLGAYFAKAPAEPVLDIPTPVLDEKRGVFITLKKHGELRGCVGQIVSDEPVKNNLKNMTLAAALQDRRFIPVSADELKDLEFHISLLTTPSPIQSYKDIRLGTDGIIVQQGFRTGVFLPEVATETGWDQKTFFEHCAVDKAGLSPDELDRAKISVFQSEAFGEDQFPSMKG